MDPISTENELVGLNTAKKTIRKNEWILVSDTDALDDVSLNTYIRNNIKTIISHSFTRKCNVHENLDDHKMNVRYYRCSSSKCQQVPGDVCLFQYQARYCLLKNLWYIYKLKYSHTLKYPDGVDRVPGIHPIFKAEVEKKLKENSIMPYTIMKSVIVN